MRKFYHSFLRFIIRNNFLNSTVGNTIWFKNNIYEEAQRIIGNR